MKWSELSQPWKVCFEEAWDAYCAGSVPIGAVVVAGNGDIVARGRNRRADQVFERNQVSASKLAHAELNA
ncbi:MAG: hypothetical protein MUO76_10470, partial [Anaerolineaceae bacterium]|nr:hypothetical protein [Anaerolineaceae bacterium]